jgi:hypothetical protein
LPWIISIATSLVQSESPRTITPKPELVHDLDTQGLAVVADRLTAEFKMLHSELIEGMGITGKFVRTIDLSTMRLALIKARDELMLVQWPTQLMHMRGKDIAVGGTIVRLRCLSHDEAIAIRRTRDL